MGEAAGCERARGEKGDRQTKSNYQNDQRALRGGDLTLHQGASKAEVMAARFGMMQNTMK